MMFQLSTMHAREALIHAACPDCSMTAGVLWQFLLVAGVPSSLCPCITLTEP